MKTQSNLIQWITTHKALAMFTALLLGIGACKAAEFLAPAKEIALIIGEPWKNMQTRSTAKIADDIPDEIWYRVPKELAYLRFSDPDYEFVTPPAKFFTIGFNRGKIDSIRMSPQIEPLPLQQALDIVLNLQEQWRTSGWTLDEPEEFPAYDNTPVWYQALKECSALSSHWNAGKLYQLMVVITCYGDNRYPDNKGYLVTISMGKFRE